MVISQLSSSRTRDAIPRQQPCRLTQSSTKDFFRCPWTRTLRRGRRSCKQELAMHIVPQSIRYNDNVVRQIAYCRGDEEGEEDEDDYVCVSRMLEA
jgi:hypothetical protein